MNKQRRIKLVRGALGVPLVTGLLVLIMLVW